MLQIFSPDFCEKHWQHTINIHHSFLPAFEGEEITQEVQELQHQGPC